MVPDSSTGSSTGPVSVRTAPLELCGIAGLLDDGCLDDLHRPLVHRLGFPLGKLAKVSARVDQFIGPIDVTVVECTEKGLDRRCRFAVVP